MKHVMEPQQPPQAASKPAAPIIDVAPPQKLTQLATPPAVPAPAPGATPTKPAPAAPVHQEVVAPAKVAAPKSPQGRSNAPVFTIVLAVVVFAALSVLAYYAYSKAK